MKRFLEIFPLILIGIVTFILGFERGKIVQEKQDDARIVQNYANARNWLTVKTRSTQTQYQIQLQQLFEQANDLLRREHNACNSKVDAAIKNTLTLRGR